MDSSKNHDDLLFQMLTECKTLPNFLEEFFGFLSRRTDFYHVSEDPLASVGLPEGLAEKLLRHTFYKFKSKSDIYESQDIPINNEEIVTECTHSNVDGSINEDIKKHGEVSENDSKFTKSEAYNGGIFNNYCWSQTITDIDVTIRLPENISKKHLSVKILPSSISVKTASGAILLDGELYQKCKGNDAIWSLEKQKLQIHIDKCQEMWWNCLIKSEPEIDISQIDCSRPYEELTDEAQAKIEELQWNQERKRMGLPTSDELVMHDTLKKAWNTEGSPFKGSFQPSIVRFN